MSGAGTEDLKTNEALRFLDRIIVWKRGDERAPHKPLLVLYALAKCLRGDARMVPFDVVDEDLRRLLLEFGPPRQSCHPATSNDGLAENHQTTSMDVLLLAS